MGIGQISYKRWKSIDIDATLEKNAIKLNERDWVECTSTECCPYARVLGTIKNVYMYSNVQSVVWNEYIPLT